MFCCCPKDQTSYALGEGTPQKEEARKDLTPTQANIHTGKGPLSTSTQSIASEASLDKTTVEAAKKEKAAITSQPTKAETQSSNHSTDNPKPETENKVESQKDNSHVDKPVEISEVEAQIVPSSSASATESANKQNSSNHTIDNHKSELENKVDLQKENLPVEISEVEAQIVPSSSVSGTESAPKPNSESNGSFVSTFKVGPKPAEQVASEAANLAQTNTTSSLLSLFVSELDALEKSVTEAERLPDSEAKQEVDNLSSQLQVLNSKLISTATTSPQIMSADNLQAVVARLEAVTTRLESLSSKQGGAGTGDDVAEFVDVYEKSVINGSLAKFLKLSSELGGDVQVQSKIVLEAFKAQGDFLGVVARSKMPDQATLQQLLQPTSSKLSETQEFREKNRGSKQFNHLSAVSEGIAILGWVTVVKSVNFIKDTKDSAIFYVNRVLKDYKESEPKNVDWAKSWTSVFADLQGYAKDYHSSGLAWNPRGGDAKAAASAPPPPPAAGGPPPPPPPGPPPPPAPSSGPSGGDVDTSALFASINKGADITKGLKKVSDDMKTHKNPQLRLGAAPFKPGVAAKPSTSPKPLVKAHSTVRPPKFELDGKKWIIEYQKDNKNLVIEETELRHTLYAYKCEGCVIQVKGKINSITLDSCKKTAIVFDDLVSSLEFVNSQSMQAQVMGKLPTVSIDKTDGCQVYLNDQSLGVEIVSAKSSEMNILVPTEGGDMKEFALPEQYKSTYNGKTMVTTATDSV